MHTHSRWSRRAPWLVGLAALSLGCHTVHGSGPYPNPSRVAQGAIVGSMAGAAIGAGVDHRHRGRGALVGAVSGLLAGALLGHEWEHDHWHHLHEPDPHAHPWWCDGAHAWEDDGGSYDDGPHAYPDDPYAHGGGPRPRPDPAFAEAPPDVLFTAGSADLSPGAKAHLRRVADRVRGDPDVEVLLRGHSDGSGDEGFDVSDARARSVRAFLAGEGVAPRRIAWVGLGDSQPLAPGDSAAGRQKNRRVEIVLREREPDPYS